MDIGYAICAAAIALAAGIAYIDRASLKAKVENAGKQVEMRMAAYRNSLRAIVKYDIAKAIADVRKEASEVEKPVIDKIEAGLKKWL